MFYRRRPQAWATLPHFPSLRRDMDRLFEALSTGGAFEGPHSSGVFPALNVSEASDNYYLEAELPGIEANAIQLSVMGTTVTLGGERKIPELEERQSYHRRERRAGSFRRSLELPNRVDPERADAKYVNGILTLTLPKAAEAKPREISISTAS